MVALLHAVWKSLVHCVMAFAWAVEPDALIVPLAQLIEDAPVPVAVEPPELLLSEPQAASAKALIKARPARRSCRVNSTAGSLLDGGQWSPAAPALGAID